MLTFAACRQPGAAESGTDITTTVGTTAEPEILRAEDFFPISENVRYVYTGEGSEYASYDMYIDFTSDNMVQQRINNGGTETVKVIKAENGRITELMSRGETYCRENFLSAEFDPEDERILLAEPIALGTTWTNAGTASMTITDIAADIETPAGKFNAIEVTEKLGENTNIYYYTADIGLVKTVFHLGDVTVSSALSEIAENTAFKQEVSFFYPDIDGDRLHYINKPVYFRTNDDTVPVLEAAYKESVMNGPGIGISSNTRINSIIRGAGNILYIDLGHEFIDEMSAGAMYELLILRSIANTFGKYYDAGEVAVTVEGKPYESGHILFESGDTIAVDYSDAVPAEESQ